MSRDQLSSGSSEERTPHQAPARPDLLGLEPDQIEAARLADVLSAVERGDATDLDPAEDPALAALAQTVEVVRSSLEATSAHPSFRSFHESSRARVMRATPTPRRQPAVDAPRESLLQRWNSLFTSIGAAAAASIATFIVTVIAIGGGSPAPGPMVQSPGPAPDAAVSNALAVPAPPQRVNLTALSITEQVSVYIDLLERLDALTGDGLPADESLLRDLAETGATVKRSLEEDPSVSGADAFVAMHTTFEGSRALKEATVASEEDQQVLDTAQATAEGAYVTAARFLTDNPDRAPSADDAAQALNDAGGAGPDGGDESTP